MSLTVMDYKQAHQFVERKQRGIDVRWDGYNLVFFKPTPFGFTNPKGEFRNGKWGMKSVVSVDSDGTWKVPTKNVKCFT